MLAERGPKLTDIAQIIVGLCTDSATSPLSTCTYAFMPPASSDTGVAPMKGPAITNDTARYQSHQGLSACP
jgi:hypothetical protein